MADKIQLATQFNLNNIRISSEYMNIPVGTNSITVCFVVRVKPEHVESARISLQGVFEAISENQGIRRYLGELIHSGRTVIKVAVLKIDEEPYDILLSE